MRKSRVMKRVGFLLGVVAVTGLLGCGPKSEADEGHGEETEEHHEEDEISLTPEQMKSIDLEVVVAGPGELEEVLSLTARVEQNMDAVAHINARVPGVVRAVHAHLGQRVKKGDLLAELESVVLGQAVSDYLRAQEVTAAARDLVAKEKELFARRLDTLRKVMDGAIEVARKIYEREKNLQEKRISTLRPFLEAEKALRTIEFEKRRSMTTLEAQRDVRLLQLEAELRQARVAEVGARDRLYVLGLKDKEITEIAKRPPGEYGRMTIRAPQGGVIVTRHISLNETVDTETVLFDIYDLDTVWVMASIYEKDLRRVRVGQKVEVYLDALGDTSIDGKVSLVGYLVSEKTRALDLRVVVENKRLPSWEEDYPLRPGMFGKVDVITSTNSVPVLLPETAIVHDGTENFVFIQEEPLHFMRKPVRYREGAHGMVAVLDGVKAGERVVVSGGFVLKSITKEDLMGEHDH